MHSQQPRTLETPKKKAGGGRHVATRQIFALPALQQYEPVLASSPRSYMVPTSSIPKIESVQNNSSSSRPNNSHNDADQLRTPPFMRQGSPGVAAVPSSPLSSPSVVPHRPKDKENAQKSPRTIRPQPPPPLGISARTDVNIYRYNQGTAQRMAIRPIFEQRKEEAQIARNILAAREGEEVRKSASSISAVLDDDLGRDEQEQFAGSITNDLDDDEEQSSEDKERKEFTTIRSMSPHSAGVNHIMAAPVEACENHIGDERSVVCQDTILVCEEDNEAIEMASAKAEVYVTESEPQSGGEDAIDNEAGGTLGENRLLQPLLPGHYHEPFLTHEGGKLLWLKNVMQQMPAKSLVATKRPQSASKQYEQTERVLHKLLWKDLRSFGVQDVMISVFLSSEGAAHIEMSNRTRSKATEGDAQCDGVAPVINIHESYLTVSKKVRSDLRILTPKWAQWIISRIDMDENGSFYLQLEDKDALGKACCYADDLVLDENHLHVEIHRIGDTELLVSVRNLEFGGCAKVLLHQNEILQLATTFGVVEGDEEDFSSELSTLLQNTAFLSQLVTKSKVIRLGMKTGEMLNELSLRDTQSATPEPQNNFTGDVEEKDGTNELELDKMLYPKEVYDILLESSSLASIAFLSRVYAENGVLSALRRVQQEEAIKLHAQSYVLRHSASANRAEFKELIASKVEAAKLIKLQEIAISSIVDDMVIEHIAYECRVMLYKAKYSGGYDDHYASKVQATYRMSAQRKTYSQMKHVRMRAARLLQALQRGIIARKRYVEMKIEREKYLLYGFRSSLHHSNVNMEDPKIRAKDMAEEMERKRQAFLMQVLNGYVTEHDIPEPFRVPAELIQSLFNEFGVVVGCSTNFGDIVASYLRAVTEQEAVDGAKGETVESAARLYSSGQVNVALILGLRAQYDDTFGLCSTTRKLVAGNFALLPSDRQQQSDETSPPRWLLKVSPAFQRSNRNRLVVLRLSKKSAGRKSSHLVARDFRSMLCDSFSTFESCRATWESHVRTRKEESQILASCSKDEIVQRVLDQLIASIKDWGVDPEPLFQGLNMCIQYRHGKELVGIIEEKFNAFAEGVNRLHGKRNILSLRDEIEQELEDFEKLLALRCLNIGQDHIVTIPPSEILHIILKGNVDDEYVRHALPTVLPIASITEKHELARKMVLAYANASYGDAFNLICWSCLDVSENVTVEAAQLLDRITRKDDEMEPPQSKIDNEKDTKRVKAASSVASRALYLFTGLQAIQFLQFLAKVAHFNKAIQHRVQAQLKPYTASFEMFRLASAVSGLDNLEITARLFDEYFTSTSMYPCTRFWVQYEELFGLDLAEKAQSCNPRIEAADNSEGEAGELASIL